MSLVVLEGIDGTGKSTQAKLLEAKLLDNIDAIGKKGVIRIAEPTNSKYGTIIRNAMMNSDVRLSFDEELDLFIQDRRYNVQHNLLPAFKNEKVVILDRYYFSTAAYQGCRGHLDYEKIISLNEEFAPKPSIVFFFFIPIEVSLSRIDLDQGRNSRSYMEKKENLEQVQAIFAKIHESGKYNSFEIDATQSIENIAHKIWSICRDHFSKNSQSNIY